MTGYAQGVQDGLAAGFTSDYDLEPYKLYTIRQFWVYMEAVCRACKQTRLDYRDGFLHGAMEYYARHIGQIPAWEPSQLYALLEG